MNSADHSESELVHWARTHQQELPNLITHGIGFVLALIGAAFLTASVWQFADPIYIGGCLIYALSLVGVYGMSTLSHTSVNHQLKNRFRILDQAFIYLLIVATYTPFALAYMRTPLGWTFLGAMWAIALLGFLSKLLFAHRVDKVAIWIYLLLGWMPIVTAPHMIRHAPQAALWWMFYGGICYTAGTIFLLLDSRFPPLHAVWHVCVIGGSAFHYFAIYLFVSPAA